jgi:hypothetical protein
MSTLEMTNEQLLKINMKIHILNLSNVVSLGVLALLQIRSMWSTSDAILQ